MTSTAIKGNSLGRDSAVIIVVLALFAAGYFIFGSSKRPPEPAGQGSMTGATMSDDMASLGEFPDDFDGLVAMGNQYMDGRNYAVAAESYRRALELRPDMVDVRTDFGACLHAMGLPERAIEEFRKVIAAEPSHAISHFNMGIVYYDLQQADSARAYWDRYLALDPNGRAADVVKELLGDMNR